MGLRKDDSVQKAQSKTTRKERKMEEQRMKSRKLIAGASHYCSRISIVLELCKCQQEPLTKVLDAGG